MVNAPRLGHSGTMRPSTGPLNHRLAHYLMGGDGTHRLAVDLAGWLSSSPRFRRFVETHRDKVRKKLRFADDDAGRRDVRAELAVAALLLADPRIELDFEPHGATRGGPDFAVAFRGHRVCFLEVTRLRRAPDEAALGRVVATKLRQLPPALPTVLVIAVDAPDRSPTALDEVIRTVRARADAGDVGLLSLGGFDTARAFYQRFLRLGAVIVWSESAVGDERATTWVNPSARLVVPDAALRACLAALRGDGTPVSRRRQRG